MNEASSINEGITKCDVRGARQLMAGTPVCTAHETSEHW